MSELIALVLGGAVAGVIATCWFMRRRLEYLHDLLKHLRETWYYKNLAKEARAEIESLRGLKDLRHWQGHVTEKQRVIDALEIRVSNQQADIHNLEERNRKYATLLDEKYPPMDLTPAHKKALDEWDGMGPPPGMEETVA